MAFNAVSSFPDLVPVKNVLVSVYDKSGLESLVLRMIGHCPGIVFYSTGGTYDAVAKLEGIRAGFNLKQVSGFTGQPEMQGGLVKTLDWKIYLGLLAEPGNAAHDADIQKYAGIRFDMVIGNFYPFSGAVSDPGVKAEAARQNIDIGGPCMLRASAKNWLRVASVSSPSQYDRLAEELKTRGGRISASFRRTLAAETFKTTSEYDAAIAKFFETRGEGFFLDAYDIV